MTPTDDGLRGAGVVPLPPDIERALRKVAAGQPPLEDVLCGNSGHGRELVRLRQLATATRALLAKLDADGEKWRLYDITWRDELEAVRKALA